MARCPNCKKELKHLCASLSAKRTYIVRLRDGKLSYDLTGVDMSVPLGRKGYTYFCPMCNAELNFNGYDYVARFLRGEQVI